MKTNTLVGLSLFFLGSFALIVGALRFPSIEFYTGGIVIALFVAGLFYSLGNTIRQAREIENAPKEQIKENPSVQTPLLEPQQEQAQENK